MHADEVAVDPVLAQRLVTVQFPHWADRRISRLDASGTGNTIYRLGEDLLLRLPRIERAAVALAKERTWLPRLATALPLAIPTPVGLGEPGEGYPYPWAVYRWLDGDLVDADRLDLSEAADDLGRFVSALRRVDATDGPAANRGRPLRSRDRETRAAIEALDGTIDADLAWAAWQAALAVPRWQGRPVWIHGDLHSANLLARDGRVRAVIDFGSAGVGDPACDMMVAWTLLTAQTRPIFRARVQVDDATWARGRGWALTFGIVAMPYYQTSNPQLARIAARAVDEVLTDYRSGS
jgi:aminoglycoside phosphotransferase (APT) family kinase protein